MAGKEKIHLHGSDGPLKSGATVLAICGAAVSRLRKVFLWDELEMGSDIKSYLVGNWQICRKCREICSDFGISGRTVYGIRNGEDEKQETTRAYGIQRDGEAGGDERDGLA